MSGEMIHIEQKISYCHLLTISGFWFFLNKWHHFQRKSKRNSEATQALPSYAYGGERWLQDYEGVKVISHQRGGARTGFIEEPLQCKDMAPFRLEAHF